MSALTSPKMAAADTFVKWLVPDRVIYIKAAGEITPSVREWMNKQAIFLYHTSATPKIHLLIDSRQVTSQSPKTRRDQPAIWHPRRGWCITIGAVQNPLLRTLANPLLWLLRTQARDFASDEDALAFLQQADSSLPDLQPYWNAMKRQNV